MKKITLSALIIVSSIISSKSYAQNEFITEWVTTDGSITIATSDTTVMAGETAPYTYNYNIEWFNKTTGVSLGTATNQTGGYMISSLPTDTIVVKITGTFPHFYIFNGSSRNKLIHVKQWGDIQWKSFNYAFRGCQNLQTVDSRSPNLTQVKDMSQMFAFARIFNSDISAWDVSNVTTMNTMFLEARAFNQDLSTWDVSNVTDMNGMFDSALSFNGDLSTWDVSNVSEMNSMFFYANAFNQDLSAWDISNVTVITDIFRNSNMSYCNMDITLNAWAPVLRNHTNLFLHEVPTASINSGFIRDDLGIRISLANPQITTPIANSVSINTPNATCVGEQTSFTATSAYTSTYKWNNTFVGNTYTFNLTQDTIVTVIAFDSLNCRSYDTIAVIANTVPTVTISADTTTICNGNAANLTAAGADSYVWSTQATGAEITVAPTTTTTYTVTGTIANGCENTASVTITEVSPIVTISADTTTICNGNEANLTAAGAVTYVWSTQATEEEIAVAPTTTTTYTVTGADANGCENTASVEIVVEECVGMEENTISVSVYPNPATEYVTIQTQSVDFTKASIMLLNVTGKVLVNANLTEENTILSVANYASGVYFVKIQAGNNVHIEKVIKR